MSLLLLFPLISLLLYVSLFLLYRRGWNLQSITTTPEIFNPSTSISIIIPARNEANNIAACIQSILHNRYPNYLLEIIVVDDFSEDATVEIVTAFNKSNIRCLCLKDYVDDDVKLISYKKKALAIGIAQTQGKLIITTDADCIVPENWLRSIAFEFEIKNPVMLIAPVIYEQSSSVLSRFQSLDFMTMQGITAAAHRLKMGNMCNGANLAFSRKAFEEVNGYEDISHIASGDDYLLMMKMKKQFPKRIVYVKSQEAIVQTKAQPSLKLFLSQRIRWASKSGKYDDMKLTAILLLVYVFNLLFVALIGFCCYYHFLWMVLLGMLLLKTVVELVFLFLVAAFFNRKKELLWFPVLQPFHILYIIIAGFLGIIGTYQWKGRTVK